LTRLQLLKSRLREIAGPRGFESLDSRLWSIDWHARRSRSLIEAQAAAAVACSTCGEAFLLATEEHPADSPQMIDTIERRATFTLSQVPSVADWARLMTWLTPQAWLGLVFPNADDRPGDFVWDTGRVFASPRSSLALLNSLGALIIVVPYYDNDSWLLGLAADVESGH